MYYAYEWGWRRSDAFLHQVHKYLTTLAAIPTIGMPKAAPAWAPGGRPAKESSDVRSPYQLPRNPRFLDPWSGSGLDPAGDRAGRRNGDHVSPLIEIVKHIDDMAGRCRPHRRRSLPTRVPELGGYRQQLLSLRGPRPAGRRAPLVQHRNRRRRRRERGIPRGEPVVPVGGPGVAF